MTVRSTPLIANDQMAARGAALGVVIVATGLLLAGLVPGTPQAAQARVEATATPALVIYATSALPVAQDGAQPIQPDPAANQLVPQAAPTDPPAPVPAPEIAQGAPTAAPVRYGHAPVIHDPAGAAPDGAPSGNLAIVTEADGSKSFPGYGTLPDGTQWEANANAQAAVAREAADVQAVIDPPPAPTASARGYLPRAGYRPKR